MDTITTDKNYQRTETHHQYNLDKIDTSRMKRSESLNVSEPHTQTQNPQLKFQSVMSKFNGQWNDWDEKMIVMNSRIDHLKKKESLFSGGSNANFQKAPKSIMQQYPQKTTQKPMRTFYNNGSAYTKTETLLSKQTSSNS